MFELTITPQLSRHGTLCTCMLVKYGGCLPRETLFRSKERVKGFNYKSRCFQIAQTAVTTGTRMFVNSLARERYPINYIYGFASEGFSYFLTSQMRHTSPSPYHSKLVRVCHDDSDYYSYTEIPIECKGRDGTDYSLVQVNIITNVFKRVPSCHGEKLSASISFCGNSNKTVIQLRFWLNLSLSPLPLYHLSFSQHNNISVSRRPTWESPARTWPPISA